MKSANPRNYDFYKRFRKKMNQYNNSSKGSTHKFREILLAGPDLLHLSICLMADNEVPIRYKIKLGAAIAYFISPIDLLPELILGPIGYADDIAILAWVLNGLLNKVDPNIILRYWAGETDALVTVQKIIEATDRLIGSGLLKKIKKSLS
ncbi:DUF1232 domain-containing protein [bacterium]|nr:DUF1232 domain-containing protein [bacterium]